MRTVIKAKCCVVSFYLFKIYIEQVENYWIWKERLFISLFFRMDSFYFNEVKRRWTYIDLDKFMKHSVRQNKRNGEVGALNLCYKSKNSKVFVPEKNWTLSEIFPYLISWSYFQNKWKIMKTNLKKNMKLSFAYEEISKKNEN